jgi:hypothetical protein
MKVALKKKSRWEQAIDSIASKVKGKTLTVNGKELTAEGAAKPAARAVGGLVIATVASAVVSSMRSKTGG